MPDLTMTAREKALRHALVLLLRQLSDDYDGARYREWAVELSGRRDPKPVNVETVEKAMRAVRRYER